MHAKGMGFLPRAEGFCSLNAALCRPGKDNIQDPTSNIQRRSKLQVPNGAIKSVGHSNMECGGKRSATPHSISCRSVTDCSNHPSNLSRLNVQSPLVLGSWCFSGCWMLIVGRC